MRPSLLLVVFLGACGSHATQPAPADLAMAAGSDSGACGDTPSLKLTSVASGLTNPTFVAAAPGDSTRLFVLERAGAVRVVKGGALAPTPFLDLRASTASAGDDDGLLGLAFHPDYATNGRFFVHYSDLSHNLMVEEYARADADTAAPAVTQSFVHVANPAQARYGGMLAFGPDGYLYIGVGDGAATGDPQHNALNLSLEFGKLLRIDVDHFPAAPAGNLIGANVDPQIWDYGLREPWRFSFDAQTHELYLADVGHPTYQSIHIEPAGSGGHNYGWSTVSGAHCTAAGCDQTGITLPTVERKGGCVIGGYVYRGTKNACLAGWYVYGDYCTGRVRGLVWNGSAVTTDVDLTPSIEGSFSQPSSFGVDSDGELYLVDYGGGAILRFDSN
jgi:glucose/arabinose dehydrogenase